MLVMYGITGGIAIALFFGNFLYKTSGFNLLVPSLTFVTISLVLFLPLALKYIPDDKAEEIKEDERLKGKAQVESDNLCKQESNRELKEIKSKVALSRQVSNVRVNFPLRKLVCNCKVITYYLALLTFTYTQHFYIAYLNTSL